MPVRGRVAPGVVEVLRLLVIICCAGVGYELGRLVGHPGSVLGPFNGIAVGVIVGSGFGYVLGGVLGRSTIAAADRTERLLRAVTPDRLVAGVLGTLVGALGTGAFAWPLLLLPDLLISGPLFCFVVVVGAYLASRVAIAKREGVVAVVGGRTGGGAARTPASALPRLLDTSVAIDGRLLEVVRAGFLHGRTVVPAGVLAELQGFADSSDSTRRVKGRRGLDLLEVLAREPGVELEILDDAEEHAPDEVDAQLVRLSLAHGYALLTLDTALARAARLAGVAVLDLHSLALALRPPVLVGDDVELHLAKPGKSPGQAVGYLDDGTMVVVEQARRQVGRDVTVTVTSVLVTANGRLVFAELLPAVAGLGRDASPVAAPVPRAPLARPAPAPRSP